MRPRGAALPARRALLLAGTALALSACYVEAPPQPTTSLRVTGNVPDASVTIDDQYLGALAFVAKHGVALPPGPHRITVEKHGYFPWDRLVTAEGTLIRLEVTLEKIPD
jgi:hypothetical protein